MRVTDSEVIRAGSRLGAYVTLLSSVKACFLRRCRTIPAILSRIHGFPSAPFAVAQNDVAIAQNDVAIAKTMLQLPNEVVIAKTKSKYFCPLKPLIGNNCR